MFDFKYFAKVLQNEDGRDTDLVSNGVNGNDADDCTDRSIDDGTAGTEGRGAHPTQLMEVRDDVDFTSLE